MSSFTSTSDLNASDFYGKLIDVPTPTTPKIKAFSLVAIGLILAVLAFVEWVYRVHPYYNQEIGLTMARLDTYKNQDFETVILSDSVMRQVFWGVDVTDDVAVLSVSARTTILGNELIARRFFGQGNTAKRVVLAFTVPGLVTEPRPVEEDTHFRPIFTRAKERRLIRERLGDDVLEDLPPRAIFKRKQTLDAFMEGDNGVTIKQRQLAPTQWLDAPIHTQIEERTAKRVDQFTSTSDPNLLMPVKSFTRTSMTSLIDYLQSQGSEVVIVVPPLIDVVSQSFSVSNLFGMLQEIAQQKGVDVRDMNALRDYPPQAFYDGTHLYPIWEDRALRDLETIQGGLVSSDAVGSSSNFDLPVRKSYPDFYMRSSKIVSYDGKSGVISGSISVPFYTEADKEVCISLETLAVDNYSNSVFISFNHEEQIPWHFAPNPDWTTIRYSKRFALKAGWNHVRLVRREDMPISELLIEACG